MQPPAQMTHARAATQHRPSHLSQWDNKRRDVETIMESVFKRDAHAP
jgi:hypothetical protein